MVTRARDTKDPSSFPMVHPPRKVTDDRAKALCKECPGNRHPRPRENTLDNSASSSYVLGLN